MGLLELHLFAISLTSLGLLTDLPSLDHLLGQIFNSLVHQLLLPHFLELFGNGVLVSALVSGLLSHLLTALLRGSLLLCIC